MFGGNRVCGTAPLRTAPRRTAQNRADPTCFNVENASNRAEPNRAERREKRVVAIQSAIPRNKFRSVLFCYSTARYCAARGTRQGITQKARKQRKHLGFPQLPGDIVASLWQL
jgi:hypothetical protein